MLLNSLYTIESLNKEGQKISAELFIDQAHEIFSGHFPSQPVLPGVCLLEMVKDIIKETYGHSYNMTKSNNIKYLSIVDPTQNSKLRFELKVEEIENSLNTTVTSYLENDEANFKLKANFTPSNGH